MNLGQEIHSRRWALAALVFLGAMVCLMLYRNLSAAAPAAAAATRPPLFIPEPSFPENDPIEARYWRAMNRSETSSTPRSPVATRYQLAGTYMASASDDARETRIAVLDDLRGKRQVLVHEGNTVDDHRVVRVEENRAILEGPDGTVELWRRISGGNSGGEGVPVETAGDAEPGGEDAPPLEINRFGKRMEPQRWVLDRRALMDYYEEVMEDTSRLATIYKSFTPDMGADEEVAGFVFQTAGEADFFKAVGLTDGDVIRSVNSMDMTSQRRAEYFLGEFVRENLNAVVLEVEREGEMQTLIYMMR